MAAPILLLASICITAVIAGHLPDSIPRCSPDSPDFEQCALKAANAALKEFKGGYPSLRLRPLDPLEVSELNLAQARGSAVQMKLKITNAKLYGLSDMKAISASMENNFEEFITEFLIPWMRMDGVCTVDGKFLLLPLQGTGNCTILMGPMNGRTTSELERMKKKGVQYINIKSMKLDLYNLKSFKVDFDNIFRGPGVLHDSTLLAINENWQSFFKELEPSLEETFAEIFRIVVNPIYNHVPEDELFPKATP